MLIHFNLADLSMPQLTLLKFDSGSEGEKEVRIIDDAAVEWQTIGTLLAFDKSGNQLLSIKHGKSQKEALYEVFRLWLQGNGRYQSPTGTNLVKLLKDSRLKALADEVRIAINKQM